ncbi:MAG: LacI family DNA-binding transcriptional regulator [Chloroflexota bacterium]
MARRKSSSAVTIIDVAREAGVSYSTVSRVVNNKSYVNAETRAKVLQAMTRMGYQANLQARSLAGGRSNVIGLLVVDLATQYMSEIMHGIDDVLASNQYELMLYTTHRRKTKESAYVNMMAQSIADGLLILLPRDPDAYLESLRDRDFPYVLIDHRSLNESDLSVFSANQDGAHTATTHLIDLGHTRIGMITGWMDMTSAKDRLAGYKSALADRGLPFDPSLVFEGDFTQSSGSQALSYFLQIQNPPTAIFASNDLAAAGVLEAVRYHGLLVPDDLSVIGFDDIPLAATLNPALTTMRQPLHEMGSIATQLLLNRIDEPDERYSSIVLPTELILRETTAQIKEEARA